MKYCISIFCLPQEIDDLELTLTQLKKAFRYIDEQNFILDITLALTGELTLWEQSKIPPEYFLHKYEKLRKNCYKDYPHSVVSPEIVKVWDNTWDCLVNEQFLNEPLDYQKTNDPYLDCGIKGDIGIETINNNIPNQPRMKFAGGWFTCISKKLLDKITVPDSLGHYGLEDTFIMWGSEKLRIGQQFKIKNLVVCENYKYRDNKHLSKFIASIDRREEFKQIAHKNFPLEIENLS